MKITLALALIVVGVTAVPAKNPFARRNEDTTATVNLAVTRGPPKHPGSGFIYGIPDTPNQIPDHWCTDIGFNYGRAGGAQLDAPNVKRPQSKFPKSYILTP